jgi:predicted lipoprotein with Yx(FWY)xxD motif
MYNAGEAGNVQVNRWGPACVPSGYRLARAAQKEGSMSDPIIRRRTNRRLALATLAAAASLGLVAGCSSTTAAPGGYGSSAAPSTAMSSAASSAASSGTAASMVTELKTATTSLGTIVVDGKGMVLYMYTKDTQGTQMSACTGGCLAAWPLAMASSMPTLTGVTGTVTMIPTASGGKQLALNGWPLYYYAKDKAAGDTLGQGVGSVWYVLDASGTPKKA